MTRSIRTVSISVVGDVDHGKSTLIARLLHATGALPETRIAELAAAARARGAAFEWSFALDALQAERDQAATIGASRARASFADVELQFRDAPGHSRFAGAAATAAASAQIGLLVVDVQAGLTQSAVRHARAAIFLGAQRWVVAANKMDRVGWERAPFDAIAAATVSAFAGLGATVAAVVPVAAREGVNLTERSSLAPWYQGASLAAALAEPTIGASVGDRGLRLPIQNVLRRADARVLVGRVESGALRPGQELLFLPSGETARVAAFETDGAGPAPSAIEAGANAAFTLDRAIYVARGDLACAPDTALALVDFANVDVLWLSDPGTVPLVARVGTAECPARISSGSYPGAGEVASAHIEFGALLCAEGGTRGVLVAAGRIVAGFRILQDGLVDRRRKARGDLTLGLTTSSVTRAERTARAGHRSGVLWLTGLPAAGKSTLAVALERRLFDLGWRVFVLDGDNLRHGLSADLGFAPGDRAENVRRAGEVAALFAQSGALCIASFVSPFRADRAMARKACGEEFREVHVQATIETCAARDPKGLYAKARAGQIAGLTGIDAPYETPLEPDLVVDTTQTGIDDCVQRLLDFALATWRQAPDVR